MQKMIKLTVMCGLSRCGKSSWIRKNMGDSVVVCPDEIRSKIFGHQFNVTSEDFVWAVAKAMVRLLLEQNKSVIIDATNLTYSRRDCWVRIAKEYGIKLQIVWIKTSLEVCKRRNAKSKEGSKVPYEVLEKMASIFENPIYNEDEVDLFELPKSKAFLSGYPKLNEANPWLCINYYAGEVPKND